MVVTGNCISHSQADRPKVGSRDTGDTVLSPSVSSGLGHFEGEVVPGITVCGVVLSHGTLFPSAREPPTYESLKLTHCRSLTYGPHRFQ